MPDFVCVDSLRRPSTIKPILLVLVLAASALAEDLPTCLIVRHASAAHQFLVSGANWQYVEGDFPKGMKWKSNITDRTVRKVKEMGGRVVTVPTNYTTADLEDARKQCAAQSAMANK
jgi:hypothetical protein